MRQAKDSPHPDVSLVRLAVVFACVFALFEAAIWGATATGHLYPLMEITAKTTAGLLSVVGIPVARNGIQLMLSTRILEIDLDCTALQLVALYAALVIAYPLSVRVKLVGLAVGVPAILVANLLRLLGVALAAEHLGPALFAFVHDFLFKVVMVLVIVALWGWWLQMARRNAAES
ncbi:MAG: archaeosortase/exosortase family protein [Coriobacteriia bacterium]|nr:archaeosortase/exosortase family protein [Coriobacteriia bacterium]